MDTIQTHFVTGIDFWMSFGIGITFAITVIGFYQVWRGVRTARIEKTEKGSWETPPGRGDFKIWFCVVLFCLASLYTIVLSKILFPQLVTTTLLVFFFVFCICVHATHFICECSLRWYGGAKCEHSVY